MRLAKYAFFMLWLMIGACSRESSPVPKNIKVNIDTSLVPLTKLNLSLYDPAFISVGISGKDMPRITRTLKLNELNEFEVPSDTQLTIDAALIAYKSGVDADANKIYYSTLSMQKQVDQSTSEISIAFSSYTLLPAVNIYGMVYQNATTPAGDVKISVIEPHTGAVVTLPNSSEITKTNANGVFAFSFFYNVPGQPNNLSLQLEKDGIRRNLNFILDIPAGAMGKTLPYINLNDSTTVKPQFANLLDFDNDGTSNANEFLVGTNPFSELSGAKGDRGDAGIGSVIIHKEEPAGGICAEGGRKMLNFRDVNGNGIYDEGIDIKGTEWWVCNGIKGGQGPQGIPGNQGAQGAQGPQGAAGATGSQGAAGQNGAGAVSQKLYFISGGNTTLMGVVNYFSDIYDTVTSVKATIIVNVNKFARILWNTPADNGRLQPPLCRALSGGISGGVSGGVTAGTASYVVPCGYVSNYVDACFYNNSNCNGTCYLRSKPIKNQIFDSCADNCSTDSNPLKYADQSATPVQIPGVTSGVVSYPYYRYMNDNSCNGYWLDTSAVLFYPAPNYGGSFPRPIPPVIPPFESPTPNVGVYIGE